MNLVDLSGLGVQDTYINVDQISHIEVYYNRPSIFLTCGREMKIYDHTIPEVIKYLNMRTTRLGRLLTESKEEERI